MAKKPKVDWSELEEYARERRASGSGGAIGFVLSLLAWPFAIVPVIGWIASLAISGGALSLTWTPATTEGASNRGLAIAGMVIALLNIMGGIAVALLTGTIAALVNAA